MFPECPGACSRPGNGHYQSDAKPNCCRQPFDIRGLFSFPFLKRSAKRPVDLPGRVFLQARKNVGLTGQG